MAKSYQEKLRDPRWQKKRLEVLNHFDFTCCLCGSKEKTLNVHHGYYERGMEPWEYASNTLWSLCEECHSDIQNRVAVIYCAIGMYHPRNISWLFKHLCDIIEWVEASVVGDGEHVLIAFPSPKKAMEWAALECGAYNG